MPANAGGGLTGWAGSPTLAYRLLVTSPTTLVVGAALVDDLARPTRLLAARRTAPPVLAGGWELPGGKVDPGEEPLTALHRELREELGVTIEVGAHLSGPLADGTWPLGGEHRMHVWMAVVASGTPAPLEDHDELRWLTTAALYDVPWLPADLPVARALHGVLARVVGGPEKS